ncbi:hypothetical protein HHI36_015548 [Cryptolaemus montrouzieri]|uniref:Endonuclease/exonuclease/phosphatase domain-containing protein n=1 Tax=Cryptolaemus montrouzieri TaxID=559131 RepID=A0ABD2N6B7_9CUCU
MVHNHDFKQGSTIILEDFNIDMSKNSYYGHKLMDAIKRLALYQINQHFTRITNESSSMIDLILTYDPSLNYKVHLTPKFTDHSIISLNIKDEGKREIRTRKLRCFNNFNEHDFENDIRTLNFGRMDREIDIEADRWIEGMLRVLNEHAPENIIEIKPNQNNKVWWCDNICLNMKKTDCLYRRAVITKKKKTGKISKKKELSCGNNQKTESRLL